MAAFVPSSLYDNMQNAYRQLGRNEAAAVEW